MKFIKSLYQFSAVRILLFGVVLSIVFLVVFGPKLPSQENRSIVIADDVLAHLMLSWEKTWQRAPTEQELQRLVQSHIRDEVLYREAISRGLDKNNAMVRRSLIMQMNLLAESQVEQANLSDQEVRAFYSLRKDQYQQPGMISFRQIYFTNENISGLSNADLEEILNDLNQNPLSIAKYGDPIMLESELRMQTPNQIDGQFGTDFVQKILPLPINEWSGPVTSAYGVHLVMILKKTTSKEVAVEKVWDEVVQDMMYEEKEAAKDQFYTELIRQYDISYEGAVKELSNVE